MRINKIIIENFRSIKHIEIDTKPLFGLIGTNSAGKSNILKILNLVLGERYPMYHSLTKKDFYNEDYSNNIKIEIYFDTTFKSYDADCNGILFKTVYNPSNNSFDAEFKAIDQKTKAPQKWRLKNESREQFSAIYVPSSREFEHHLQTNSEWYLLGKVIKQFNRIFPKEKYDELNSKFESVKLTLATDKFKEFEKTLKDIFKEHILPTEHDVEIGFKAFNPKNYYKTIEIIPKENEKVKNIDQMGEGMKNLIFISLLRTYAKLFPESTIFLIEEPELYLSPQGRADLFNIFLSLTKNGSQVIYSTHSQEFIDIEYFSNICTVRKIKDITGYCTEIFQIDDRQFLNEWKVQTQMESATIESIKLFLKNISNSETNKGFFAKKIVLVEGQTEKWSLATYAENAGYDFEKNNIEIINVNGKTNIEKFYLIFKNLKYPIYVIFDGDKPKKEEEITNKKLTKLLSGVETSYPQTIISERFAIFEENYEMELKKNVADYSKLESEARQLYGLKSERNKEIVARFIANNADTPEFVKILLTKIKECN